MDPERVRAYLQAACAGLGFDVGEVWWTSSESGSSTVAAIGKFFFIDFLPHNCRKEGELNQCFSEWCDKFPPFGIDLMVLIGLILSTRTFRF